jgi:hypothetical protein
MGKRITVYHSSNPIFFDINEGFLDLSILNTLLDFKKLINFFVVEFMNTQKKIGLLFLGFSIEMPSI